MRLVEPSKEMEAYFIEMANDNMQANELRYKFAFEENFDFNSYIEKLHDDSKAEKIKPGYVPSTTFWLVDDHGKILGVSRLRHYLLPHLEIEGGHIGYDVPPSERMKGYGTILLKHVLLKAEEMGINKVLITCDADNIGSAKIIKNNGGVYENEVTSTESGKPVSRYWINISQTHQE
jgi:predicted acetyltransferase